MPRVNLIGASNRHTNQTCHYGSMAGLAPTTNVRPNVTGLPGYKVGVTAANQHNNDGTAITSNTLAMTAGCGLGKRCADGTACLKHLSLWTGPNTLGFFQTGRSKLLG
tara:strand:+ start:207 stop:530 length:324 start_codon:yes stop_codon:yes gene_type:complete